MPYRKEQFVNDDIYHLLLKGVAGRLIFKDIDDYYRGIFSIYEFNATKPITIRKQREIRARIKHRGPSSVVDERDKLVEVLAFCFMPNHIHLLLKQLKDNGITKFMSKLGTGYGGYFNRKYGRKGYVFQNRFCAVRIKNDEQLKNIFVYIHTNPTACIRPHWKEKGIENPEEAINFLENFKWSSYLDYIGKKNFPSVTERNFILAIMKGEQGCKEFVEYWIRYKGKMREFTNLSLEE